MGPECTRAGSGTPSAVSAFVPLSLNHAPAPPVQVPAALQDAVKHTLEAVSAPDAAPGVLSGADASAVWGCLADCMRDPSDLGSRAGRGWLVQLLVAAAEHELARSSTPPGREAAAPATAPAQQQGNGAQQQGSDEDEGDAAVDAAVHARPVAPPPMALLPEVATHGGCQLQPGRRGMQGQMGLRELLMRALVTTPDSRAADCFMAAVSSLLAHVRLRCAAASWEQDDGWGGSSAGATSGTPHSSSLRRQGSSAGRLPLAHHSLDSLPDAETSQAKIVPSESGASTAHSSPFDGQGGGWRVRGRRVDAASGRAFASHSCLRCMALLGQPAPATCPAVPAHVPAPSTSRVLPCLQALDCPDVVISTLSLAVEWVLQAPQEARQGAMLRATELLLTFTLAHSSRHCGSGGAALGGSAADGAAAAAEGPPATPFVSPAARPGTQPPHRLAGQVPTPLQVPPSPATSPAPGSVLSAGLPQRPLSPSMAALQAAAAATRSTVSAAAMEQARPGTPRASSLDRLQGEGQPSAVDIVASAAVAAADDSSAAEQLEAEAAAAAEARATVLWSFLNGEAMLPQVRRALPMLCMVAAQCSCSCSRMQRARPPTLPRPLPRWHRSCCAWCRRCCCAPCLMTCDPTAPPCTMTQWRPPARARPRRGSPRRLMRRWA